MRPRFPFAALALACSALTVFLGYFAERSEFSSFIAAYLALFGVYLWAVFRFAPLKAAMNGAGPAPFGALIGLGLFLRALLLFSEPNFSDDYARFLWDGHVALAGYHPFSHTPDFFVQNDIGLGGYAHLLYPKLNSPAYHTVYPPVCQAVFAASVWLFPNSAAGGVFVMKTFLWLCEMGTVLLLGSRAWGASARWKAAAYALNPLAIVEVSGNAHFEGAMVFFLIAGLTALWRAEAAVTGPWRRSVWAACNWALATASKMVPLLFLPVLWSWLGWKRGWAFMAVFAAACLLLFAPIAIELPNMLESLDLYFRQFQFNASLYYLVRWAGYAYKGWDIGEYSGPALAGLTFLAVLGLALKARVRKGEERALKTLTDAMLLAVVCYHLLAATVQPWYVLLPFALSLMGHWRFGIAWSAMAALSYSHYDGGGFKENYALIAIEYAVVGAFFVADCHRAATRS